VAVADEAACRELLDRTVAEYGQINMLVYNAGITAGSRFAELPDLTLLRRVIEVNFLGIVHCTYYALPFLKQVAGRIVNLASMSAVLPIPYNTAHVASKHAMRGYSDSLRMELNKLDVSVTLFCPYWVVTEFPESILDRHGQLRGHRARRSTPAV
jgi:short-subunit dehydrogenase